MNFIILSAILFGLVHPGSKLILGLGISLIPFCLLYIGIRLIVQVPIILRSGEWRINSKSQALFLGLLGLIGAGLQVTEFYGVSTGLPIGVVSFLVYTHPVWTLLLSRFLNGEKLQQSSFVKIGLAIVGIAAISGIHLAGSVDRSLLVIPLLSGIMIALWISVSNKAAKAGCTTKGISFYYDLIAFFTLVSLSIESTGLSGVSEAMRFVSNPNHLALMIGYSILIGLVPNYLFYFGSKKVPALAAGLILLLEPVISSIVSHFAWNEPLSAAFVIGAVCILSTNVPSDLIGRMASIFRNAAAGLSPRATILKVGIVALVLLGVTIGVHARAAAPAQIHIVEVVPSDSSNYTVTAELKQMEKAFDLAAENYKASFPKCNPVISKTIKRGPEEELFATVKKIATTNDSGVLVGLSRSTFARVAAKAASGSNIIGIALGASTTNLREINPNFVSIASPRTLQWKAINDQMVSKNDCSPTQTLGIFDSKDHLSGQFKDDFVALGFKDFVEASVDAQGSLNERSTPHKCIFIGMNFSDAQPYIQKLITSKWKGSLFGIGDWNMFSGEVRKMFKNSPKDSITAYMPTGWAPSVSSRSGKFSETMKATLGEAPSPVGAYAYDTMILAMDHVCNSLDPRKPKPSRLSRLPLLRKYTGIAESGNYLSQMLLVKAQSEGRN